MTQIAGNVKNQLEGKQVVTTAPAQGKALTKTDAFRGFLSNQKGEFEKVLPSHISFEKFQRTVMTAVLVSPDLLEADRASLMVSCIKAATDGLLPDNRDAALVIFNSKDGNNWIKKVQYLPMYAGILKKVRQSGEMASVVTHVVYEKDKFEYILGDEERIAHEPYTGKEDRGAIIAAYCIAKLKDGTIFREVMSLQDIEKVRRTSKSGNDEKGEPKGIWKSWYEEMARKTVFRRMAKWLPQSIEKFEQVFSNDDSMGAVMDSVPGGEPEAIGHDEGVTIDHQTGEILSGSAMTQPDLKAEVEKKKETVEPAKKEPHKPAQVSKPYTPAPKAAEQQKDAAGYPVDDGSGDKEP